MLRIIQKSSAASVKSYYASADYFTEGQELEGIWRGKAAAELALSGKIEQKDWDSLCDHRDPATGKQLTVRRKQDRRVGWDFNFSVPKSISLLYALDKDQRILDAFQDAVDQTMLDVERDLQTRIRKSGQNSDRTTGNGVWGRFIHFTSRPVDSIPDPQLHAHCVLFNITKDPSEDRWKAAQIGAIKRDANYYSALMHSRLAARLVELGIPIERTAKSWRIAGIDAATESKFSRRTRQIDRLAQERGIVDPLEKAELGAKTRERKNKQLSMEELRSVWQSWLTPHEADALRRITHNARPEQSPPLSADHARTALHHAAEHHFERASVVPYRQLLTTALHHALGKATPTMVLSAEHRGDLIFGADERGRVAVTSPRVLKEEQQMLAFARSGRNRYGALIADEPAAAPDWFNSGQKKALNHLLTSRDVVTILRGVAGAGKTSLLSELKSRAEASGKQIFAFAPSAEASRGVLREAGYADAETLSTLLVSPKLRDAIRNQIILVDEASQIGSRTMARLFTLAQETGARIILSGDRYQHGSVERGSALRLLEEEAGLKTAALTEIMRQRDQYRQAVAYLSQGRVEPALHLLHHDLKWIHEIHDPQQRYERIAAEYLQATEAGQSAIIISPTHRESEKVTQAVRAAMQHEGKIGPDQTAALKLTNLNLTSAQRRDPGNYTAGDMVIFTQNAPGIRKGSRLTVGVGPIPFDLADRFNVYRASTLNLAEGDLLRITANGTTADGHRINNGQTFTIRKIAADGTLTLNNGWHIGPTWGHLDYGICTTSHASQGKTVDRVIVAEAAESFPAASREQLYVSVSRGRKVCSIYTDDHEGLLEAVSESTDRLTASELASQQQRRLAGLQSTAAHQHEQRELVQGGLGR